MKEGDTCTLYGDNELVAECFLPAVPRAMLTCWSAMWNGTGLRSRVPAGSGERNGMHLNQPLDCVLSFKSGLQKLRRLRQVASRTNRLDLIDSINSNGAKRTERRERSSHALVVRYAGSGKMVWA